MKTKEVLELDFRESKNKEIIQKVLKKIKPLSKIDGYIQIEYLEKLLAKLNSKYGYYQRIFLDSQGDYILYHCYVEKDKIDIFGISVYEVLAKSIIYIYSQINKN